MKLPFAKRGCIAALALALALAGGGISFGQAAATGAPTASAGKTNHVTGSVRSGEANELDAPETHSETESFRHSATVKMLARYLHIDMETASQIFEDLNSAILIIVILVFLWKWLPKAFRTRTETIRQQVVEAQTATEAAGQRLSAVEARLAMLSTEIEAMRQQAERDSVEDEKRIRESMEEERERIVKSAGQAIDAATASARRELKRFAANLAVERALGEIHLTPNTDRALVQDFEQGLSPSLGKLDAGKGGRN